MAANEILMSAPLKRPAHILPLIIISQFAGTSLWFAVNAILPDIIQESQASTAGNFTSIIQLGFITGTLVFAIFSIADRFASSKVFFLSSVVAALANVAIVWNSGDLTTIYALRFTTGFFLAGIYPVGMKIAADWFDKGLGKALGYLVGALVLGTAFPNLLKSHVFQLEWKEVLIFTSAFAIIGGALILFFVGDGPYRKTASRFQPSVIFKVFKSSHFKSAAFGYFGHMWELYTFWSLVPMLLSIYNKQHQLSVNLHGWAFLIVAVGSLSCVLGGYVSQKSGSSRVAFYALLTSGICCLASIYFPQMPPYLFYPLMLLWGISVVADSPQFSTLVAQTAPPEYKGTALTIVTSFGFAITIISIQLLTYLFNSSEGSFTQLIALAPGPLVGLVYLWPLVNMKK
jgi:MFS family permease